MWGEVTWPHHRWFSGPLRVNKVQFVKSILEMSNMFKYSKSWSQIVSAVYHNACGYFTVVEFSDAERDENHCQSLDSYFCHCNSRRGHSDKPVPPLRIRFICFPKAESHFYYLLCEHSKLRTWDTPSPIFAVLPLFVIDGDCPSRSLGQI